MKTTEVISTAPIDIQKSIRGEELRTLTSCKAGKIIPVAFAPVLREDRVNKGNIRIALDMAETIHPLMNQVHVTAFVHFVPFFAFDRFTGGMDSFNRSYQGVVEPVSGTVIPFFQTMAFDKTAPLWKTMGVHWKNGTAINSAVVEAYNEVVNYRYRARSENLTERAATDTTLANAFWKNSNMGHIVPTYDSKMIDGEVPLTLGNVRMPLRSSSVHIVTGSGGTAKYAPTANPGYVPGTAGTEAQWGNELFVQLMEENATVSLANIEAAKKTAAFAKLRDQYSGLKDDHIIDLLMEGIRVPDETLKNPILLDRKSTYFGYNERPAMDGASLDMSVTTGSASLDLSFRTPPMNTGGVILVTLEIVPEQLFERCKDGFLGTGNPAYLPNALRDMLDAEPVAIVKNDFVDVEHSDPTGTFGYAPLNHQWKRSYTRIGGRYYRPNPDAFSEDRQRFWAIEKLNPTLTTDFYLCPDNLPHSVFLDNVSDPFEILAQGAIEFVGNTVFGSALEENSESYEKIAAQVDFSRISQ